MQYSAAQNRKITSRDRSIAFLIFGFLLACYLFTYTGIIQSSDGLAMFATVESMVRRGEIDTNQLLWMGNQQGAFGPDGNLYSRKGLGMPLLAYPLVWLAKTWPAIGLVQAALLLNTLLTAWTGALLYRSGRRLGWRARTSVATALIFGLATLAWPYTQTFFSDPVCAWGLFAAFYGLLSYSQTGRKRYLALGGIAWGLAYLARVVNLLTLPLFLLALIWMLRRHLRHTDDISAGAFLRRHWRPLVSFLVPVVVAGLLSLGWNWARYGAFLESGYAASERFDALWWFGVGGLLVGPARGLLWYSPAILLAIPGAIWFWRRERVVFWLVFSICTLYVLVYGKWYMWHGGYSWGPRFLVPVLSFIALWIGAGWMRMVEEKRWGAPGRLGAWIVVTLSFAVQWLGLLIPFGSAQEWLATNVQPLFAPATFVRPIYSPLLLQWQFLEPDNIHLAWWQASRAAGDFNWGSFLVPLVAIATGLALIISQLRRVEKSRPARTSRNWLYGSALCVIALAMLVFYQPYLSNPDNRALATLIAQLEQPGDVVLHLQPDQTQQFANAYHGDLAVHGLFAQESLEPSSQLWQEKLRGNFRRIWVVPNQMPPERSGWETPMRTEDYLLLDSRPGGQDAGRLALYAMADAHILTEAGIGTIFGDPEKTEPIGLQNGWIRLEGYAVTEQTEPGAELLLSLRWRSLQVVDYDYHVFVHFLDEANNKVAQRDGQPVQWTRPTSTWQPGEEIVDNYGLLLPSAVPNGTYRIAVGLYDPVSGQRLPVSAGPQSYAIELGPIAVISE